MVKRLVRFLWKIQPRFVRAAELELLERVLSRPIPAGRPTLKGDIVICGLLGTASGLGQAARHMLDFIKSVGLAAVGANASKFAILEDFDGGPFWPQRATKGGIIIFHINPDILSLVWNALGRKRLSSRRIVGLWAWELDTPPEKWRRAVNLVDEIWAPSHFVADALRKIAGDKPVHFVPHVFDVASIRTTPKKDPIPELFGKTIVFFAYDVRSLHARKNPEAVIAAFREAAATNQQAVLIIKINNNATWPEAGRRVERAAAGLSNVVLMHDKLSDDGMQDLMARVDIVISLHRSEGFGMLMASAMAAAKPVIATGWSANLDFMDPSCSVLIDYTLIPIDDPQHIYDKYDALWADADVGQAAKALKRLLADPQERQTMGRAARAHVESFFSKEAWFRSLPESFWGALDDSTRPFPQVDL